MSLTKPQHETQPHVASALSPVQGVKLIAERELQMAVRSKAFIWGMIISVLFILAAVLGQKYIGQFFSAIGGNDEDIKVGTTIDESTIPGIDKLPFELQQLGSVDEGVEALKSGDVDALVVMTDEAQALTLYDQDGKQASLAAESPITVLGNEDVKQQVVSAFTVSPNSAVVSEPTSALDNPMARMWIGMGFGVLFFSALMMSVQRLAQSIVEEKASRIVELLVSTVTPSTILAGKIIAGTILAVGQLLVIAVALIGALAASGSGELAMQILPAAGWFILFTLLGYMVYAAMYAAVSATLSRPEDVASATAPIVYLMMVPYIGPFLGASNEVLMTWLSYIPISSPVAMPVRIFFGDAQWWEPLVSLVILVATAWMLTMLAGRIYRNSILRSGRVKMIEALKA